MCTRSLYTRFNSHVTSRFIDQNWSDDSACSQPENDYVTAAFYAETPRERDPARNLCVAECEVRMQCLRWALEHAEIWGVWGGCDESELRRALSLNASKQFVDRSRHPHCPYCGGRPGKLKVIKVHRPNSHRIDEHIECIACGFEWRARSSIAAVKAYWKERRHAEKQHQHAQIHPRHT